MSSDYRTRRMLELGVNNPCTCEIVEAHDPVTGKIGHITLIYDIDCPTHTHETRHMREL